MVDYTNMTEMTTMIFFVFIIYTVLCITALQLILSMNMCCSIYNLVTLEDFYSSSTSSFTDCTRSNERTNKPSQWTLDTNFHQNYQRTLDAP